MDREDKQLKKVIWVVLNPVAGNASAADIRAALERHFSGNEWSYEIYETTGEEDVAELTRKACQDGANLVIAAGGDGTVAGAVNGLVHSGIPLGIVPVGTGNGLARALKIPLEMESALALIAGEHELFTIDAMQVDEQFFTLNVSVGISARAMRKTPAETKRRFGMAAYVWSILGETFGFSPRRFTLTLDTHQVEVTASEILVSNGVLLVEPPKPLGPPESFNDGYLDVYVITASALGDYLRMLWELVSKPNNRKQDLRNLTVKEKIVIDHPGRPQPVQADGELIGKTPVEILLVKDAVAVITPKNLSKNGDSDESKT